MRVISWNMGIGGPTGSRFFRHHDQAWHYLLGLGPDLALVQEALPPAWARAEGTLVHGPFREWGSAIFTPRLPLQPLPLPEVTNLHSFGSYLAYAAAALPDGEEVFVASVHARAGDATAAHLRQLETAREIGRSGLTPRVNDAVFGGLLPLVKGRRFLVGGDWNTGREQSNSAAGQEFFDRAQKAGWLECSVGEGGRELQTGFGTRMLRQNDHIFCDQALKHLSSDPWVAGEAAQKLDLSDHAPLIVDFDLQPIAMTSLADETPA